MSSAANEPLLRTLETGFVSNLPVPELLLANACPNLILHSRVGRTLFGLVQQVQIEAACKEYQLEVKNPKIGCGHCHEFR